MMLLTSDWRTFLYPLGFFGIASFGTRFIIQWIHSEWHGESRTPRVFWQISLLGNSIMVAHSCVQLQYPAAIMQCLTGVCAFRQVRLFSRPPIHQVRFPALPHFCVAIAVVTLVFFVQGGNNLSDQWFRIPSLPWASPRDLSLPWYFHALGCFAMILFGLRFWIQWWQAERGRGNNLGQTFWKLSLAGAVLSLLYYLPQHDWVNILTYGLGVIPYTRNLALARQRQL